MSGRTRRGIGGARRARWRCVAAGCGSGTKPEAKPEFLISASVDKTSVGTVHVSVVTELEGDARRRALRGATVVRGAGLHGRTLARLKSISPLPEVIRIATDIVVDAISIGITAYQRIEGLGPSAGQGVGPDRTDREPGVPQTDAIDRIGRPG